MKHLISLAAVACAFTLNAAYMQTLKNGINTVDAFGEIVAIEANTISASQVVTACDETVVNEYTNVTESVIVGKALKASYTHSVSIGSATASGHYAKITPGSTVNFMGGFVRVRILIK